MLLKIKFDSSNYDSAISKLHNLDMFYYRDSYFYINIDKSKKRSIVKKGDTYIEIGSDNLEIVPSDIKIWCKEVLVQEELKKYEKTKECQDHLKIIMDALNVAEEVNDGKTE